MFNASPGMGLYQIQNLIELFDWLDPTGGFDYINTAIDISQGDYLYATLRQVPGLTLLKAPKSGKIPWGSWKDYQKVTVNGQEYAQVGNRLYSRHAVDRMQPSGMSSHPCVLPSIFSNGDIYAMGVTRKADQEQAGSQIESSGGAKNGARVEGNFWLSP